MKKISNAELRARLLNWDGRDWNLVREMFERTIKPTGERLWTDEQLDDMTMDELVSAIEKCRRQLQDGIGVWIET